MGRKRRQFTAEYKLETVRLVQQRQAAGGSLAAIGRELGIKPDLLRAWTKLATARRGEAHGNRGRDVFPGNGKLTSQDEELRRLKREVATLREERDILGKATAFFANKLR